MDEVCKLINKVLELLKPVEVFTDEIKDDNDIIKWRICSSCKKVVDLNDNYCRSCGKQLLWIKKERREDK